MPWKQGMLLVGKYVLLTIIFYVLYVFSSGAIPSNMPVLSAEETQAAALGMMLSFGRRCAWSSRSSSGVPGGTAGS
jgi:hypothetical protein